MPVRILCQSGYYASQDAMSESLLSDDNEQDYHYSSDTGDSSVDLSASLFAENLFEQLYIKYESKMYPPPK